MLYRLIKTKDGEFHLMGSEYLKRVKGHVSYGISATGRCVKWDINKVTLWDDPFMVLATTKDTIELPRLNKIEIVRSLNEQARIEVIAENRYQYDMSFHDRYDPTDKQRDAFTEGYMEALKEKSKLLTAGEVLDFIDKYVTMQWSNKSDIKKLDAVQEYINDKPNDQWQCEILTIDDVMEKNEYKPVYWTPNQPLPYMYYNFVTIKKIIR